ncbi:hypothetical protein N8987_06600 [Crocinitomix sp.]|nr:hypothetical protein [Crocinitomix sp.]
MKVIYTILLATSITGFALLISTELYRYFYDFVLNYLIVIIAIYSIQIILQFTPITAFKRGIMIGTNLIILLTSLAHLYAFYLLSEGFPTFTILITLFFLSSAVLAGYFLLRLSKS